MRNLAVALLTMVFACSCRPPYTLGPKDPLFVIITDSTSKYTIKFSDVIQRIKAGDLGSTFSPHEGPTVLYFRGGLKVGLYKNMSQEARNEISKAISSAPNIIITGVE